MIWKVKFAVDNGYSVYGCVCIIEAEDKTDAENKFNEWIKFKLMASEILLQNRTIFQPIRVGSSGVIYTNLNGWK